jgi:hypothetical protein
MAFLELTKAGNVPCFCNIHFAVGRGCTNRRDDVLLVQYLLRTIYSSYVPAKTVAALPPGEPLAVTGHAGESTFKYILHFQQSIKGVGGPGTVATDGRVDRAHGFVGVVTGCRYTIIHLNDYYSLARPALNRHLWIAPDCPVELQRSLLAASKPVTAAPMIETHGGGV